MAAPEKLHSTLNGRRVATGDLRRLVTGQVVADAEEREDHVSTVSFVAPVDPCTLAGGSTVIELDEEGGLGYDAILAIGVTRMLRENLLQSMLPLFVPDAFAGTALGHVDADVRALVAAVRAGLARNAAAMGTPGGNA